MRHDDVRNRLVDFLSPRLAGRPLADDDDIFALGYVNSLFAMQLALFVEKEFGIGLEPEDMDMENFRTLAGLVRLVTSKTATAA